MVPVPDSIPSDGPSLGLVVVLSGGMFEPLLAPEWVPDVSAPSLAAKLAADAVANKPARSIEVKVRVFMVRLQKGDLPDIGLKRALLGADRVTSGTQKSTVAETFSVRGVPWVR
ncbi:hypothetical protein JJN09_10155 [Pseudomonas sp. HS6]|nr:hypothetical protein JJN09_10155 [Pseudomonas sp. HS6]